MAILDSLEKLDDRGIGLILFIGFFALYLNTAAPTLAPRDSAEWAVACATLGIPHAPGYPLYILIGKCATLLIPWANIAYRLNLSSALFSAGALLALYQLCRRLALTRLSSLAGCLFLGTSRVFWTHASQAEVFGLHLLLVIAGLYAVISHPTLSAFLLGLSLGNHHTSLFALPCAVIVLLAAKRVSPRRLALLSAIFLLSTASIQGVIILRSRQKPVFQIAEATTPKALIGTFLRKDYGTFRLYKPPAEAQKIFPAISGVTLCLKMMWDGMGPVGMGLAAAGFPFLLKSRPGMCLGLAILFLLSGPLFFTLSKPTAEPTLIETILRFESMPLMVMVIYLACGLSEAMKRLSRGMGFALGGLALGCGLLLFYQHRFSDQRERFSAADLALNILADSPRPSLLFPAGDTLALTLIYAQKVEKRGQGVILASSGEIRHLETFRERSREIWPRETKKAGWLKRIAVRGSVLASFEPEERPGTFSKSEGWAASPRGLLLGMRPEGSNPAKIRGPHIYRFRQIPRIAEGQEIYDLEIFSLYMRACLRNAAGALLKKRGGMAGEWLSQAELISPSSKGAQELRKKLMPLETHSGK